MAYTNPYLTTDPLHAWQKALNPAWQPQTSAAKGPEAPDDPFTPPYGVGTPGPDTPDTPPTPGPPPDPTSLYPPDNKPSPFVPPPSLATGPYNPQGPPDFFNKPASPTGSTPSNKPTRKGWSGGPSDPATYSGGNGKLPGYSGPTGAVDPGQWSQFTGDLGTGNDKQPGHTAVHTLADRLRQAGYDVQDGPISETDQLDSLYINGQLVRVFDSSGNWNYQPDVPGSPAWDMPGDTSGGGSDTNGDRKNRPGATPGAFPTGPGVPWTSVNPNPTTPGGGLPFQGPGVKFTDPKGVPAPTLIPIDYGMTSAAPTTAAPSAASAPRDPRQADIFNLLIQRAIQGGQ